MEIEIFHQFLAWQQQQHQPTLVDAFAQLRQLCAEENYTIEIPAREDLPDPTDNERKCVLSTNTAIL